MQGESRVHKCFLHWTTGEFCEKMKVSVNPWTLVLRVLFLVQFGEVSYGWDDTTQYDQIRNDIKRALYFDGKRSNLDDFISLTFDLTDPNPEYRFILPDKRHTRLVMRRSDFRRPVFPNMTNIYIKFSRMSMRRLFQDREGHPHNQLLDQPFKNNLVTPEVDSEENIFENVRTEPNFIRFMEDLNQNSESFKHNKSRKGEIVGRRLPKIRNRVQSEWKELGLPGWDGEIFNRIEVRKPKKLHHTTASGGFSEPSHNFLDNDDRDDDRWDLPGKVSNMPPPPSMEEFSEELRLMSNMLNSSKTLSNIRNWPITMPRIAHRNKDVFIARSNDPFGYSTKWEYRNSAKPNRSRRKRGVGELYSIMKCGTGCDPLIFKGYGCYCGFLGAGQPTDGIDRCCRAHDICYSRTHCPSYLEYFVPYLWKCFNGLPICAVDNGEWGRCATQLCKCDKSLANCIRKYQCPRRRAVCYSNRFRLLQNYFRII